MDRMHADYLDENVVIICVHLRLEILESPGEEMREAGRLRNGLERDAPATIHPRANPFHGTMFTRSPARVRVKSLAAFPAGTRMQPCEAG